MENCGACLAWCRVLSKHEHLEGKAREGVHPDLTSCDGYAAGMECRNESVRQVGALLGWSAGKSLCVREGRPREAPSLTLASLGLCVSWGSGCCLSGVEMGFTPRGWQQRLPDLLVGNFV